MRRKGEREGGRGEREWLEGGSVGGSSLLCRHPHRDYAKNNVNVDHVTYCLRMIVIISLL